MLCPQKDSNKSKPSTDLKKNVFQTLDVNKSKFMKAFNNRTIHAQNIKKQQRALDNKINMANSNITRAPVYCWSPIVR